MNMPADKAPSTVFYDGSCPLCTLEVQQYQKITPQGQIAWVDVSCPAFRPPAGLSQEALMRRFHALKPDGEWVSGAAAFVHIWAQLPGWRHLAQLAKIPGVLRLMELGYVQFLKVRPRIQSWFKQRSV